MSTNVATIGHHEAVSSTRGWSIALWVTQALLAAGFGLGGLMKLTTPLAELGLKMHWVSATPDALVRFIGLAEVAGALGMLLPALTRIRPRLTPLAGAGLALIMVLAAGVHISIGEAPLIVVNFVLGGMALFVVWGRLRKAPITPRAV